MVAPTESLELHDARQVVDDYNVRECMCICADASMHHEKGENKNKQVAEIRRT